MGGKLSQVGNPPFPRLYDTLANLDAPSLTFGLLRACTGQMRSDVIDKMYLFMNFFIKRIVKAFI